MASKFDKSKAAQGIKQVAKESNEKANLISIKYYKDEDLIDYPQNNENVDYTEDIEKSIDEQGFTDPIEITDFGMENGKFMILSGHRRRRAGRKKGMKSFPCILRHFHSQQEVKNYVLFGNSHRDSAKDPLLLAKRYKMHEEYLKEVGFKGSLREEVAVRLGLRVAQADRYSQMNKVILPFWDMIREGKVGMSSITDSGLYRHTPEEQEELLNIMKECLVKDIELTRPYVKKIVTEYRNGCKTLLEIMMGKSINEEKEVGENLVDEIKEENPLARNDEINYDTSHREGLDATDKSYEDEKLTKEDYEAIDKAIENEEEQKSQKKPVTDEEKRKVAGEKIIKNVTTLENLLNEFYTFKDEKEAHSTINAMAGLVHLMIDEMKDISEKYGKEEDFSKSLLAIEEALKPYKN